MIRLEKKPLDGLGLEVSGGYRVGIYVVELQEDSVCKAAGLHVGDRLFKVRHSMQLQLDPSFALKLVNMRSVEQVITYGKKYAN